MTSIPRPLVADALGMPEADLPPGDLPLSRLATRFLDFLHAGDEIATDHPDAWTFALFDDLTRDHPDLALQAIVAVLAACNSAEDVADIAAGPLEDLIASHGAQVISEIETLAAKAPRFGYALTGVWPQGQDGSLLWARIKAARRDAAQLDAGAPLPPPDGLT